MDSRPWYKKKRYIGSLVAAGIIGLGTLGGSTPAPAAPTELPVVSQPASVLEARPVPVEVEEVVTETAIEAPAAKTAEAPSAYSSSGHYTNVDGDEIQSPTYYDSAPAGASAECRDGTYSFSAHRQGTCSHHGGVAEWL